ncbi:MAG: sigma-70 family RNA polymerase sigma factor [Bdellovibrionota bacterium]
MSETTPQPSALETKLRDLVIQTRAGESHAYPELLENVAMVVKKFILKKTSSTDIAEEVTQEVLIGVHKALPTYQVQKPFSSWLFSIARYKMIDYWRKHEKDKLHVTLDATLPNGSIDGETDQRILVSELMETLQQLPSRQMRVIYLSK